MSAETKTMSQGTKHSAIIIGLLAAMFVIVASGCGGSGGNGSKSISIAETVWNYDLIVLGVVERALEAEGWDVTRTEVFDLGPTFAGIAANDINMYPGYWLPTLHASFRERYPEEQIRAIGNIFNADTPVGFTIPTYTAEEHGIVSIADLQGHADVFGGRIVGYEPGTGGSEAAERAVRDYELTEYEFLPSSLAAMLAELESAVNRNVPIIVVGYRPSPMFAELPVVMLEDPLNVFGVDHVSFAVNAGYADAHPDLVTFMENFAFPLEEMEALLIENEQNGVPEDQLAEQWYNENQTTVESWWN